MYVGAVVVRYLYARHALEISTRYVRSIYIPAQGMVEVRSKAPGALKMRSGVTSLVTAETRAREHREATAYGAASPSN